MIMLEQWRAGLRVSEALALEARDLHLDSDRPTLVVRQATPGLSPLRPSPGVSRETLLYVAAVRLGKVFLFWGLNCKG